jgi:hypothetical protein
VRLFHFSEDPAISEFVPRTPEHRPEIDPYVWVVDGEHGWTYYFPRECPRVLLWPTAATTDDDLRRWFGGSRETRIACVEWGWLERMRTVPVYRYEMDPANFRPLEGDGWMLVSREIERPMGMEPVGDLVEALGRDGVELRLMATLAPLFGAWEYSFHFSGIRLRNALGWPEISPATPPKLQ